MAVFITTGLLLSCVYLLYLFLCAYPGNLSPDSINQLTQIKTGVYSNHHPYYHTLLIKIFYELGMMLFHEVNAAVATYLTFQCIAMSFIFAYVVMTLYQMKVSGRCWIFVVFVYMLTPYHWMYATTMWKDVLFGAVTLLLITSFYRYKKRIGKSAINKLIFFISVICFCLWRSNGMFAFLIFFAVMLVHFTIQKTLWQNKYCGQIVLLSVAALMFSVFLKGPMLSSLNIDQPDIVEALSIPEQQIARTIYDGKELSNDEIELIDMVADYSKIREVYNPNLSDPIKKLLRASDGAKTISNNKAKFIKLYISVGCCYPFEYFKAWVDQTKGYWNAGYHYWVATNGIHENDLGIYKTVRAPLINEWTNDIWDSIVSDGIPSLLVSIGLVTWVLIYLWSFSIICKTDGYLEITLLLAIIVSLVIATPVYCEFRYSYGLYTALPFVFFSATQGNCADTHYILNSSKGERK